MASAGCLPHDALSEIFARLNQDQLVLVCVCRGWRSAARERWATMLKTFEQGGPNAPCEPARATGVAFDTQEIALSSSELQQLQQQVCT